MGVYDLKSKYSYTHDIGRAKVPRGGVPAGDSQVGDVRAAGAKQTEAAVQTLAVAEHYRCSSPDHDHYIVKGTSRAQPALHPVHLHEPRPPATRHFPYKPGECGVV